MSSNQFPGRSGQHDASHEGGRLRPSRRRARQHDHHRWLRQSSALTSNITDAEEITVRTLRVANCIARPGPADVRRLRRGTHVL